MLDPNVGARLAGRYLRRPSHCLYCSNIADTDEHSFGQAIGGRLQAPILCGPHNRAFGKAVDDPMAARFAFVMSILYVPRQDGKIAAFAATFDDDSPVRVAADGHITGRSLNKVVVHEQNDEGKMVRGEADLRTLDALVAAGKLAENSYIIATGEGPPPINVTLDADELTQTAALKVALHFVAGFVTDIDPAVAAMLLPYALGEKPAGGTYVRGLVWDETLVPRSWPPRHEVTCYPSEGATYVTVLFFDWTAYKVRLPFDVSTARAVRYTQILGERFPRFSDDIEPYAIDWDAPVGTDDEITAANAHERDWSQRLGKAAGLQNWRNLCHRAVERAREQMRTTGLGFFDSYEGELHAERVDAEIARGLVAQGRTLLAEGKPVWEVDLDIHLDPT